MSDQSNMQSFVDDLMKDVRELGRDAAQGKDSLPKLALRVAQAADTGIISLDKDSDGHDDFHRIYGEYVQAESKKAVHEHSENGKKANISKLRAVGKMVLDANAKYDGIQTLQDALEVRGEQIKVDPKQVKPAYHALVDASREQVKLDRQMTRDELVEVVTKPEPADPDLEKKLTTLLKSVEKIISGEAGVMDRSDEILTVHDQLKQRIAALALTREQLEVQEKASKLGLQVVDNSQDNESETQADAA